MALSADEKFIYVNPDTTASEYNLAKYYPVKYLRGIDCTDATFFYIYFRGPKDAISTRVQISITSGFIKDFFIQFVDEINFGENAVITLADRAIAVDATTGGTDFQHVNAYVVPITVSDSLTAGNEDVQVAEDLDVGGALTLGTDLSVANGGTGASTFTDGGILLGSGTDAITATAVLGDGEILIGDGTTDPVALDVGSSTAITTLGTVDTGVWNGTAVASAYLDSDTAHLTTSQTFTGNKIFSGALTASAITNVVTRKFVISTSTDGNYQGDVVFFGGTTSMITGALYHYKSDGTWELADADAVATCDGLLGIALGAASDTNGILLRGMVTLDHDPGAVGDVLFVSTTSGDITATAPSGNTDIVRVVGYCLDASNGQIWFNPDGTFVEVTA
tara:strand:- start:103 stop:1278 length:1176 start_codon:yes stop_codon:yes gene_type:complete